MDVVKLLFKFVDNVINNLIELKYWKIWFGNFIVEFKLFLVVGVLECLFEMGFVEVK